MRSTVAALGLGLAGGFAAALIASQFLASSLYGLSPFDPIAYLCVTLVLSAAALAATYVPANRAMRVAPTIALRCD